MPHWPDSSPKPHVGIRCLISHDHERVWIGFPVCVQPRQLRIRLPAAHHHPARDRRPPVRDRLRAREAHRPPVLDPAAAAFPVLAVPARAHRARRRRWLDLVAGGVFAAGGVLGRLPAVDHRQRALRVLASAPLDLLPQPALANILVGNAVRELPQVLVDLVDAPAAAQVMADDDMEGVAAIAAQRTLAHDLARSGRCRSRVRRH